MYLFHFQFVYIGNCNIVKYELFIATLSPYLCLCVCSNPSISCASIVKWAQKSFIAFIACHRGRATGAGARAEALVNIVLNFK